MKFIKNFFVGLLIGFGAILPGVSSGVFCVIFGIYDKLIAACSSLFKDFKKNFSFLFPIGMGAILGVILFGNIIKLLFFHFESECKFAFIGLILGSLPVLFKRIYNFSNFYIINIKKAVRIIVPMLISFLVGLSLIFVENSMNFQNTSLSISSNYLYLFVCGLLMSAGVIIPGVSNTLILMCLGVYPSYINAISSLNTAVLLPLGIGLIIGCAIWIKLIELLLKNYYQTTFSIIIGFTLGSIFVLLPKTFFITHIFLLFAGFAISFALSKKHQ